MRIEVIHSSELDESLAERWRAIQTCNPELVSPYFAVEFTQAVAAVRSDVYIGVLESEGRSVGFFPHHRRATRLARPIGLGLSDYHGLIVEPGLEWSAVDLLKGCGLVRWEFDHLIASQAPLQAFHDSVEGSPILTLTGGLDAYIERRKALGDGQLKTVRRKIRSFERDFETYRFIDNDTDPANLERVFALKSSQCRSTGTFDYFSLNWTKELVRRLHSIQTPGFAGVLSTLVANDQPIALHFGLRSPRVWHWWFPTYEHSFRQYSPGLLILWEMICHGAATGLNHIDLGKGMSDYKSRFMTDEIAVATGVVSTPSLWNGLIRLSERMERLDRHPILRPVFYLPAGMTRRARRRLRFD